MLNIDKIRKDFPILKIKSNNKDLIFFDNGASSQKPKVVLDKIKEIYETKYANIHRGIYNLSQQSTEAYEESRKIIQKFLTVLHQTLATWKFCTNTVARRKRSSG